MLILNQKSLMKFNRCMLHRSSTPALPSFSRMKRDPSPPLVMRRLPSKNVTSLGCTWLSLLHKAKALAHLGTLQMADWYRFVLSRSHMFTCSFGGRLVGARGTCMLQLLQTYGIKEQHHTTPSFSEHQIMDRFKRWQSALTLWPTVETWKCIPTMLHLFVH